MAEGRSYGISKQVVWEAYRKAKANREATGVDGQSLEAFEKDLKDNLDKIWNRMSSGAIFHHPFDWSRFRKTRAEAFDL